MDADSSSASPLRRIIRRGLALVAGGLFVAYAVAAHWAAVADRDPFWAVAFLVTGIGLAVALNARSYAWLIFALFAVVATALFYWHPVWLIYLPPTAFDFLVAWFFVRSLLGDGPPLIGQYMRSVYEDLPPHMIRHARAMTWIWACVMAGLGVLAAGLALLHYAMAWSMVVNVISYAVMAAMFVLEYVYRLVRFPREYHISPLGVLRVVHRSRLISFRAGGGRTS